MQMQKWILLFPSFWLKCFCFLLRVVIFSSKVDRTILSIIISLPYFQNISQLHSFLKFLICFLIYWCYKKPYISWHFLNWFQVKFIQIFTFNWHLHLKIRKITVQSFQYFIISHPHERVKNISKNRGWSSVLVKHDCWSFYWQM